MPHKIRFPEGDASKAFAQLPPWAQEDLYRVLEEQVAPDPHSLPRIPTLHESLRGVEYAEGRGYCMVEIVDADEDGQPAVRVQYIRPPY